MHYTNPYHDLVIKLRYLVPETLAYSPSFRYSQYCLMNHDFSNELIWLSSHEKDGVDRGETCAIDNFKLDKS